MSCAVKQVLNLSTVKRLFQRFSVPINDVKVEVLKSRHPDWTNESDKHLSTFDKVFENGDQVLDMPIVVSCYQGFEKFPATNPRKMAAGNINDIQGNIYTIKTPSRGALEIKADYPSSYHMFTQNKTPSDISEGRASNSDWCIGSIVWVIIYIF